MIVFDDMTANMLNKTMLMLVLMQLILNKNLHPIVTELFIKGSNLNITLAFIRQSYFAVLRKTLDITLHTILL